jgi:tetratricopeptide (TPR) repeat protein
VKSNLLSVLSVDNDGEINKQLKSYVLKHIQQKPDQQIYSRLLIWLFIQEKNFVAATRQMIALDKRTGQESAGILDLANISASNDFYDDAAKAYDYLISKGKDTEYYGLATQQRMLMQYEKFVSDGLTDPNRIKLLQTQFDQTFTSLGISPATSGLLVKYTHLLTFYMNQPDEALKLLNQTLAIGGLTPQQVSELKAELADVNVYSGDFGEAIITYSQVIESNKNNLLGDDIKYKKARLGYYMGNFSWAKAQLNALRASTSKLIANDAMDLSLFINENLEDSITTPLELFARADLQIFRRNFGEAIIRLDSISQLYPDNSLADDVLFRKAAILQEEGKFTEAAELYDQVVKNYSWDSLADDALFRLAGLYQSKLNRKPEAMDLYKKMLTDYPSSVFVVDARSEYRKMQETGNNSTIPDTPAKN